MTSFVIIWLLFLSFYFNGVYTNNDPRDPGSRESSIEATLGTQHLLGSLKLAAEVSSMSIDVSSLGRVSSLGSLYDIRFDRFLEISLLETLPYEAVTSVDNHYSTMYFIRTESYSEKFEKLSVEDSQRMSFLAGILKVSESSKYLTDTKRSRRSARSSVVYSTYTKRESFNIFSESSREELIMDLLDMTDATHVVVAIEWGARVVLSVEDPNSDNANAKYADENINMAMDTIRTALKGGEANVDAKGMDKSGSFTFRMYGDISSPNGIPQNFTEAIHVLKQTPTLAMKTNHGKGKQIKFTLLPVDTLRRVLKREVTDNTLYKRLDEEMFQDFVKSFDEIQNGLQMVYDLREDITKWKSVLPLEAYVNVTEVYDDMSSSLLTFKSKFAAILVDVRSGSKDREALIELREKYSLKPYSRQDIESKITGFDNISRKIMLYNLFSFYGSRYIGKSDRLENILASNFETEIIVLYFDSDCHNLSSDLVQVFLHRLKVEQAKESNRIKYFFLDSKLEKERLSSFKKGKLIVYDLIDTIIASNATETSITTGTFVITVKAPVKREYVLVADYKNPYTSIVFDPQTLEDIIVRKDSNLGGGRVLAVVGDILYSMGGGSGQVRCTRASNVLKSTFDWEECGEKVTDVTDKYGNALVLGNNIYCLGNSGKFWEFDTLTNTTKELNRFGPESEWVHSTLIELNGVIYGCFEIDPRSDCKYMTLPSGTWTSLDSPQVKLPTLITSGSDVCVVGGLKDSKLSSSSSCFNTLSKSWSSGSSLNNARYSAASARLRNGTYLIFGDTGFSPHSIEYFDEITQRYVLLNKKLPITRPSAIAFELTID